jgi:hypothetical protein
MSKLSRRELLRLGLGTTVAGSALVAWMTRRQVEAKGVAPQNTPPGKSILLFNPPRKPTAQNALPTRLLGQPDRRVTIRTRWCFVADAPFQRASRAGRCHRRARSGIRA